jgi:hypothetical protein
MRDLFGVAIEHQGRTTSELADPMFARLTPSRVIDVGLTFE